ncbi:MAG TPA: hypothetical protein VIT44_15710, partial [Cyclobacteriaceae bacterium]
MKNTILVLLCALITLSCQKSTGKVESKAFVHQRNSFFNNLMAPSEVATQLKNISEEFNERLTSNPENYLQYAHNEV